MSCKGWYVRHKKVKNKSISKGSMKKKKKGGHANKNSCGGVVLTAKICLLLMCIPTLN